MPNVYQIRERLADWLSGKISLTEFEDWFVPATWRIESSGDDAAENLVDEIELNLSEYSGGYLSREQLMDAMRPLLASLPLTNVSRLVAVPHSEVKAKLDSKTS